MSSSRIKAVQDVEAAIMEVKLRVTLAKVGQANPDPVHRQVCLSWVPVGTKLTGALTKVTPKAMVRPRVAC